MPAGLPHGAGYVFRASALDKKRIWVTTGVYSGHGQILHTTDGGKNWTPQPVPADPQVWVISFVKQGGAQNPFVARFTSLAATGRRTVRGPLRPSPPGSESVLALSICP